MAKEKKNPKREILESLQEDAQYKKFRKIVKNINTKIEVDKYFTEATSLHAGRTSRKLHDKKEFNPRALIEASLKDLSIRSRLVEMRIRVTMQTSRLEEAIASVRHYLTTEYYDQLSSYTTVDQKRALIDRIIAKPQDLLSDAKNIINVLDTLIKDIDQANFHLKTMVEALKLLDDSKGKVI